MLSDRGPKILYSKVTSDPAAEPITTTEAKLDLKIDTTDEDDLLTIFIQAAREAVENRTGRSLITQTRVIKMDYFPMDDTIRLPNGPVISVTHVKYYDETDTLVTLSTDDYWVDTDSDIARIVVENYWPAIYDKPNAVVITYSAGYGPLKTDVPAPLRKAILLILGHLYENRQAVVVSGSPTGVIEIPMGAEYLMNQYVLEQDITY